jgi:hypothetical protein
MPGEGLEDGSASLLLVREILNSTTALSYTRTGAVSSDRVAEEILTPLTRSKVHNSDGP